MTLTRGATYVVGGGVGMDETHQVNTHFNWDNLSLFSLSLFLISILFSAGRVDAAPGRLPPLCHFRPENLHSVRGCPKKVEKTSSKNTTFEISEHPYRTCGSLGGIFFFFDFPIFEQKPIIPFVAVPKKSKKRQAKTRFSKKMHLAAGCP